MMVVFFRNLLGLVVLAPFFIRHGPSSLKTERLGLHLIRAGLNLFAMAAFYIGLSLTPLAEATSLAFTAPLFAVLLAICFLGEKVGLRRWTAIVIGFAGALVILQPGFSEVSLGAFLALASALSIAMAVLLVKKMTATETSMSIVFWMVMMQAPIALVPRMMVVARPPRSSASTPRQTQGVTNALMPIRPQNAACAAAPPPPSRT